MKKLIHSKKVQIRISEKLKKKAFDRCEKLGITFSDYIRDLIIEDCDGRKNINSIEIGL